MGQVAGIEFFSMREETLCCLFHFYSHTQEERLSYASLMSGDHFLPSQGTVRGFHITQVYICE